MTKAKTTVSLLLAGLLGAGGAFAQSAPTSDVPVKAGEASTTTGGAPNMATTNNPAVEKSSGAVVNSTGVTVDSASSASAPNAMGANAAPSASGRVVPLAGATVTSNVPSKSGEASTMTGGVPNMSTRNEVVSDSRTVYPSATRIENVPTQAGEASTMVNGRPNGNPADPMIRR